MVLAVFFFVFAAIAVLSSLVVVTARNPVRSVLALVVTFVAVAGTWMLLQAEFLSLVLIVVYVGAVMVLFLFVVMMLDVHHARAHQGFVPYWPFVLALSLALFVLLVNLLGHFVTAEPTNTWNIAQSNLQQVGLNLFTNQLYPFELAALILLAAMISAISLTFRGRQKNVKAQVISRQVRVTAKDRLKLMDVDDKGVS